MREEPLIDVARDERGSNLFRYPESANDNLYVYDDVFHTWWYTDEIGYPFIYAFDPPTDKAWTDI